MANTATKTINHLSMTHLKSIIGYGFKSKCIGDAENQTGIAFYKIIIDFMPPGNSISQFYIGVTFAALQFHN